MRTYFHAQNKYEIIKNVTMKIRKDEKNNREFPYF